MTEKEQWFNQFQHALNRPDAIIGSIKTRKKKTWIYDGEKMVHSKINYNNGLAHIFYEVLSNAIDNKWRSDENNISMKKIEISFTKEGEISIWNDGRWIDVIKKDFEYTDPITQEITVHNLYPAELYFGYMLTGTNYNDKVERKTSGKNGMGAKAANVFSKEFIVECCDPKNGKIFEQTFSDNLKKRTTPLIKSTKRKTGYTRITFTPDYSRFSYDISKKALFKDFKGLLFKYAYDCAMITGLNVSFNGKKISVNSLLSYAKLFFPKGSKFIRFSSKDGTSEAILVDKNTEVKLKELPDVEHMGFVNGNHTETGGAHVDGWRKKVFTKLVKTLNSRGTKNKPVNRTTAKQIYPYLFLFVRCEVDKPEFTDQMKNFLDSPVPSLLIPSADDMKKVIKWPFIERLDYWLSIKSTSNLTKATKVEKRPSLGKKGVDANYAGKKGKKLDCTLLLTEGNSAKTLVESGIGSAGLQNTYGVLAIRGKMINPQIKSLTQVMKNEEFRLLRSMLNLQPNVDYSKDENFGTLRYGRLGIFADADPDGDHIKGLVINMIYYFWPELGKRGFIMSVSSPILRIFKTPKTHIDFYSKSEYEKYMKKNPKMVKKEVKYFKGLGGLTPPDALEIFLEPKHINFTHSKLTIKKLGISFGKDVKPRKEWMLDNTTIQKKYLERFEGDMRISNFIDSRIKDFAYYTWPRAIPSVFDGMKVSQRKILFGCFLKKLYDKTLKVNQLQGFVMEHTQYHHGEASISGAIIGMAQGYVGSNNIPLLVNDGQFGSRIDGGKDASAGRYISTKLEAITRVLFPEADFELLENQLEDNMRIEPKYYVPILPMVLINGVDGIATGFSSKVPCHNPMDIIRYVRGWLNGDVSDIEPIIPWYRNFTGRITMVKAKNGMKSWISEGKLSKKGKIYHIEELPIGLWTGDFKLFIENKLLKEKFITDYEHHNTANSVHFILKPTSKYTPDIDTKGNLSNLRVKKSLNNMHLLDKEGKPRKFNTVEEIIEYYCPERLSLYKKRRSYQIKSFKREISKKNNILRFILLVVEKKLDLYQSEEDLDADLEKHEFEKIGGKNGSEILSFDYLLRLQLRTLTLNKVENLKKEIEKLKKSMSILKKKTEKDMWLEELDLFEKAYTKFLKTRMDDAKIKKPRAKRTK